MPTRGHLLAEARNICAEAWQGGIPVALRRTRPRPPGVVNHSAHLLLQERKPRYNVWVDDVRWKQRFTNFARALHQLTLAVELLRRRPLSDLEKQGLVQGFEFTHELAWNVLKDYLEYEGVQGLVGSRGTIREAFARGIVADGEVWMDMIEKRNLSSHTYNLEVAAQVVDAIADRYAGAFAELRDRLQGEL